MRVHFASGEHRFDGWWNVDLDGLGHVIDQGVDLLGASWPENLTGIDLAYVGHFLEHLTPAECAVFLAHVHSRMASGGQLVVVGPDTAKADALGITGPLRYLIGAHGERYGNDRSHIHEWDCTGTEVAALLEAAGFADVFETDFDWLRHLGVPVINAAAWQCVVIGTRP